MSILIKGMDMPKTRKTIIIYQDGTIIEGDVKGTKVSKAQAVEIDENDIVMLANAYLEKEKADGNIY